MRASVISGLSRLISAFAAYSTLIETSEKLAREKPDLVQRFVDASIKGCYGYQHGDPSAAKPESAISMTTGLKPACASIENGSEER